MEYLSLNQLAAVLGVHRTNARKIAYKLGIMPDRRQLPSTRHQRGLAWTAEQVDQIRKARADSGFIVPEHSHSIAATRPR